VNKALVQQPCSKPIKVEVLGLQDRFTVYDVFAVLVPGVIFMYLLAFTLDRAVGVQLFDWKGSIGDAALLFVFGYAAGAFLQALGNALIEQPWLWI
jgi:hypothetical protein